MLSWNYDDETYTGLLQISSIGAGIVRVRYYHCCWSNTGLFSYDSVLVTLGFLASRGLNMIGVEFSIWVILGFLALIIIFWVTYQLLTRRKGARRSDHPHPVNLITETGPTDRATSTISWSGGTFWFPVLHQAAAPVQESPPHTNHMSEALLNNHINRLEPSLVARTRSKEVGVPERNRCPITTVRVSLSVASSICFPSTKPMPQADAFRASFYDSTGHNMPHWGFAPSARQ